MHGTSAPTPNPVDVARDRPVGCLHLQASAPGPSRRRAARRVCKPVATAIRTNLGAIFVSLELSRSIWLITSVSPGGGEKMSKHSVPAGDTAALLTRFSELDKKAFAQTGKSFPIIVIQEAGLDGFWIHRVLQREGIESYVVDAASIATSRRRRRAKTDRIDGEALVRAVLRVVQLLTAWPSRRDFDSTCWLGEGQQEMAKPYSQDLRDRVIDAVRTGRMSRRAAARHYAVSESVAVKWLERVERQGSREPAGHGGHRASKLMPHRGFLEAARAEKSDVTLQALCDRLLPERGVKADTSPSRALADLSGAHRPQASHLPR